MDKPTVFYILAPLREDGIFAFNHQENEMLTYEQAIKLHDSEFWKMQRMKQMNVKIAKN